MPFPLKFNGCINLKSTRVEEAKMVAPFVNREELKRDSAFFPPFRPSPPIPSPAAMLCYAMLLSSWSLS